MLNSSLEWKLAIKNTTSEYTVTQDYRELLVYVSGDSGENTPRIPFNFIKGENTRLRIGSYASSTNYGFADIIKNGDTLQPSYYKTNSYVTAYTTVYYR